MLEDYFFIILPIFTLICILFPELNLILFLLIGRIGYEPRLGFFDLISLNHLNIIIIFIHLAWMVKTKQIKLSLGVFNLPIFILFLSWVCLSFLISTSNMEYALEKINVLIFVSFISIIFYTIRIQYLGLNALKNYILFFALIGIGMSVVGSIVFFKGLAEQRLAILGGGPIVLARIIGSTIIIIAVFYKDLTIKYSSSLIIFFIFLLTLMQLSTLSKGPLLGLIFTIAFYIFTIHSKDKFFRNIFTLTIILFVILGTMHFFGLSERYFLNPFEDISDGSYGTRFRHYINSFHAFSLSPIIGIGIGDFALYGEGFIYPHNIFLEIISELGIIGLLIFLGLLLQFTIGLFWYLNNEKFVKDRYLIVFILLSLFMFSNQMVSGDLMDGRFLFFYISISSLLYQNSKLKFINYAN